ncbi:ABC transporter substrate-binding protein [Leifsonia kafniensis]|uniref:ABC transporter substrate-binding protein n=1 Tax=Leifsonia kafniensis TaxID=475957 RepID=A0ABP7KGT7_9MICO
MKRSIVALVAGTALIALSGCAGSGAGTGDGSTLNFALSTDPGKINPITNATQAGQDVAAFTYESLVSFPVGTDPVGLLADSWVESPTEVTFTLKDGITCGDGSAFSATDVAATFEYAEKEETGSPYRGVYFPAQGLTVTPDEAANTVTFTSEQPQSFLVRTIGALPIVCASGLADPSKLDTEAFGTGPYTLTDSSAGQDYSFTLRDDYTWGPNAVTSKTAGLPKTVKAQVVASASTQVNLLQSGEIQLATVGGADRDRLKNDDYTTLDVPLRPGLIFFNQAEGRPAHDLEVRQAIGAAIDRDEVGTVASSGRGEPITNLVSPMASVCLGYDSADALPEFDVDKANSILDAAGWVAGTDGIRSKNGQTLTVKMLFPAEESAGVTAAIELLQQKLAVIGVDAVPTPSSSYTDVIFQGGDWDLVWAPIYTSLPSDWQGILSGDFPPNGGNWTYNTNQEYFDLAAQAQTLAGEESCETWTAAQDSLFTNLEVLPTYSSTSTMYGKDLTFGLSKTVIDPTSLRLTK